MSNKWTPGPFSVQKIGIPGTDGKAFDVQVVAQPGLEFHVLAEIRAPYYPNGPSYSEQEANAALFSLAPELVEALDDLVSVCDEGDGEAFTNARNILRRVRGQK